jgi:hypothetical protein
VVVLGTLTTTAVAQQTGTLAGVIRDAQGGVLPGVTVTAVSPRPDWRGSFHNQR